jgi:HAE1 family hydrophobic/amphiphilic exporter-1
VKVDRKAAARLGLTENAVGGIVAAQMRPSSIGSLNVDGNATPLYIIQKDLPETIAEVRDIRIPTATGSVSLDSIADVYLTKVPTSITTEKGDRTATVSLTPEGKNLGAISKDVTERLAKVDLPTGVVASIGGVTASQAESFAQLGLALLAAIAIVFIVMVATFSSIRQPLVLLISIPFAATGALGLLLLTDTPLGVSALIGMLLLVGIVVTNAIVLIDLINQYRKEGKDIHDAIMDGARQRLRPILMTALATIFALMPMALGITGGGGFISQPLAIVVIGGLFSSTVLTLVIVPVLYWLVEGGKDRKQARAAKKAAKPAAKRTKATKQPA